VRGVAPLDVIDTAFPGRAAFDVAVSRALLREVALGKRAETLRLYRPDDVVAFSTTDLRRPGFPRALRAAREAGFDAALRLAGGAAAAFSTGTIAFAWCTPERDERAGIRARFARTAEWVARALRRLGVDARVGEVPGAYCPGDWSVNARGQRKLMGVGQRVVRGAAHTGGVLVVGGSERVRAVLAPVYAELGFPLDPASVGAIEDEVGPVSLEAVREALLAELAEERELRAAALDPEVLEQAARFETSHRIA
jgi:octanoyl-[GcvH]:protein N-octanoyltransferase